MRTTRRPLSRTEREEMDQEPKRAPRTIRRGGLVYELSPASILSSEIAREREISRRYFWPRPERLGEAPLPLLALE